jgi:hypothetical protein
MLLHSESKRLPEAFDKTSPQIAEKVWHPMGCNPLPGKDPTDIWDHRELEGRSLFQDCGLFCYEHFFAGLTIHKVNPAQSINHHEKLPVDVYFCFA